jgi:hypothetical protein
VQIQRQSAIGNSVVIDYATKVMSTHAARYQSTVKSFLVENVAIHLPDDFLKNPYSYAADQSPARWSSVHSLPVNFSSDCYETSVVLYKENPYVFSAPTSLVSNFFSIVVCPIAQQEISYVFLVSCEQLDLNKPLSRDVNLPNVTLVKTCVH